MKDMALLSVKMLFKMAQALALSHCIFQNDDPNAIHRLGLQFN